MQFFREQAKTIAVSLITIFSVMVLYWLGALRPIEGVISTLLQPLQTGLYRTITLISPTYQSPLAAVIEENTSLKEQLAASAGQAQELEKQLEHYQEYAEQLAFAEYHSYTLVPARIVSRVGQNETAQLLAIDQGADQGVAIGYPVLYGDGVLIGTIFVVHETYAEVALITQEVSQIQGMTQTQPSTVGLIQGQFGTGLQMEYILKSSPIAVGDVVITNGQDKYIPAGLVIGTVQQVTDEASELFKSATLSPLLRYGNDSLVSVIISTSPAQ